MEDGLFPWSDFFFLNQFTNNSPTLITGERFLSAWSIFKHALASESHYNKYDI
jgi:hypothetical protein